MSTPAYGPALAWWANTTPMRDGESLGDWLDRHQTTTDTLDAESVVSLLKAFATSLGQGIVHTPDRVNHSGAVLIGLAYAESVWHAMHHGQGPCARLLAHFTGVTPFVRRADGILGMVFAGQLLETSSGASRQEVVDLLRRGLLRIADG